MKMYIPRQMHAAIYLCVLLGSFNERVGSDRAFAIVLRRESAQILNCVPLFTGERVFAILISRDFQQCARNN